jgi:hypothetical protein
MPPCEILPVSLRGTGVVLKNQAPVFLPLLTGEMAGDLTLPRKSPDFSSIYAFDGYFHFPSCQFQVHYTLILLNIAFFPVKMKTPRFASGG